MVLDFEFSNIENLTPSDSSPIEKVRKMNATKENEKQDFTRKKAARTKVTKKVNPKTNVARSTTKAILTTRASKKNLKNSL